MTAILTDILTIYTIVIIILFIGLTLLGLASFREERLRHTLLVEKSERKTPEPLGISVVVGGMVSLQELERLMSLDYFNYEVVLVAELDKNPLKEELLRKYSMTEVKAPHHKEIGGVYLQHLYRSRAKRYRKLIIADQLFTTITDAYNCGVCMCGKDYVIAINRWTTLGSDSLRRLSTEIQDHSKEIYAIGGLHSAITPNSPICVLDYVVKLTAIGAGIGSLSGIGTHPNISIMFEYNAIIDAGGYRDNFSPDLELYIRMKELVAKKIIDGTSIFTPQIITRQIGGNSACCSKTPYFALKEKSPIASRRTISIACATLVILIPIAIFTHQWEELRALAIICATAYAGAVAIALISLISTSYTLTKQGYKGRIAPLALITFIYPFHLIKCLISPKNFIKS